MHKAILEYISKRWDESCIPCLSDYIRIPNQSPAFDAAWERNGLLEQAMDLLCRWVETSPLPGITSKKLTEAGRTPLLLVSIPGSLPDASSSIMMYGHMDKQPPLLPWADGLGPYNPLIKDGKLYGRGGADDGYSIFSALTSLEALHHAKLDYPKVNIIIEASEESGSPDLENWMKKIQNELGKPDLIVCLDSGALNYDQLWLTSSLRGIVNGVLTVSLLNEGIHSGMYGGLAPCTFRILRQLISRIEDEKTGEILLKDLHVPVPADILDQVQLLNSLGDDLLTRDLPLRPGCRGMSGSAVELALANTWKPCLAVTGMSGVPPPETAGNVLRMSTSASLSIRIPPTLSPERAGQLVKDVLEKDPPYGAHVAFQGLHVGTGWAAPSMQPWLFQAVRGASETYFEGRRSGVTGVGGSIPFMAMLGKSYPQAQFVITGVLGPKSNAHGPNEFLHLEYVKKVTACLALIVNSHFRELCGIAKKL